MLYVVSNPSTQVSPLQFEVQKGVLSDSQVNELHSLLHDLIVTIHLSNL